MYAGVMGALPLGSYNNTNDVLAGLLLLADAHTLACNSLSLLLLHRQGAVVRAGLKKV